MAQKGATRQLVAENRKARHNFELGETFEAGLSLVGTEVKSLRNSKANIAESYVGEEDGELYLINAHIAEYTHAAPATNHHPRRLRKLLLHRREIHRILVATQRQGMTVVPLRLYFNERGIAKLEIALAKGKKMYDKRETERRRDWERRKARLLREKG